MIIKKKTIHYAEHFIQCQCVQWFRTQHPRKMILSIPNGGSRFNILHAMRLQREGLTAGVPDLFIPEGSNNNFLLRGLFVEMKSATGRMSKDQMEMGKKLKARGYAVEVCRSLGEFINIVNSYLTGLP